MVGISLVFYQLIPTENLVGKFLYYKLAGASFLAKKGGPVSAKLKTIIRYVLVSSPNLPMITKKRNSTLTRLNLVGALLLRLTIDRKREKYPPLASGQALARALS